MSISVETRLGTFSFDGQASFAPADESVPGGALPEISLASIVKTGINSYFVGSWCISRAQDRMKVRWAEAEQGRKKSDAPKEAYDVDAEGFEEVFESVKSDFMAKLLEGYEAGSRGGGGGDPVLVEAENFARNALTAYGKAWGLWTPQELISEKGKKSLSKLARDEDPWSGPGGETFGEGLDRFMNSETPAWSFYEAKAFSISPDEKPRSKSEPLKDYILRVAKSRVEARKVSKSRVVKGEAVAAF